MSKPLISDAITLFLNFLRDQENKSSHTISNYQRYLNRFRTYLGDIQMSLLTDTHLLTYRKFLSSSPSNFSKSSQNYHLSALREFIKFTRLQSYTDLDPQTIHLHHLPTQTPSTVADSDLQLLKNPPTPNSSDSHRDNLVIELLSSTGLKVSELIALNITDVFPNYRQLTIGSSRKQRTLLLTPSCSLALEKYLKTRTDLTGPLLTRSKASSHNDSSRLSVRTIQRTVQKIANNSKLSQITPSAIRNQFASTLFQDGTNTRHVSQILGHKSQAATNHLKQKLATKISIPSNLL